MSDENRTEMNEEVKSEASEAASAQMKVVPIEEVWQYKDIVVTREREIEPYPEQRSDRRMAVVMFVLAYLAVDILGVIRSFENYGLGVSLFCAIYGIAILIYAKKKEIKIAKEGLFWFGILVVTGFSYSVIDHHSLGWFLSLFLRLTMIYFPLILFGAGLDGQTSDFFVLDCVNASMLIPLNNFRAQWKFARKGMQQIKVVGTVVKALLGVLISIPLFVMVAGLLASADSGFNDLLYDLTWNLREDVFRVIWVLLFSLPVGCYLYGVIYGAANKRGTGMISKDGVISVCKVFAIVPVVSIYAALTGLCLLYLMFISLQGSYCINAMRGVLPAGFTYSEYARQGFFELVQISLINIIVLGGVELFGKTKGRLLKGYRFVLSLLTIFLIITAMTKMVLYIQVYGLTQLRVISSVFMIFLAVVFMLIMAAQFRRLPLVRLSVCFMAAGITVLALSNMDGQIARYNLARYQAGTLTDLPAVTLYHCGAAAVGEIFKVWEQEQDPDKKEIWEHTIRKIRNDYEYRYGQYDGLAKWNWARSKASYYSYDIMADN